MANLNELYKQFSGVVHHAKIGTSPAAANIQTRVLYINDTVFNRLPEAEKEFIIAHELGHCNQFTRSEHKADNYAHQIATTSMKASLSALYKNLKFNKTEDFLRYYNQAKRVAERDFQQFGNSKLLNYLNTMCDQCNQNNVVGFSFNFPKPLANISQNIKEQLNNTAALANKIVDNRHESKLVKIETKGNIKVAKQEAKAVGYTTGGYKPGQGAQGILNSVTGVLSAAGPIVSNIIAPGSGAVISGGQSLLSGILSGGGGGSTPDPSTSRLNETLAAADRLANPGTVKEIPTDTPPAPPKPEEKKDNTMLYVSCGIGLLLLIIGVAFAIKSSKHNKKAA